MAHTMNNDSLLIILNQTNYNRTHFDLLLKISMNQDRRNVVKEKAMHSNEVHIRQLNVFRYNRQFPSGQYLIGFWLQTKQRGGVGVSNPAERPMDGSDVRGRGR
jgi:hypothetical protein